MHETALRSARLFFETYCQQKGGAKVIDLGSQNVNGSIRDVCPSHLHYYGVDFVPGKGVDHVLDDPYVLPFDNESIDILMTSSVLEHSQLFWILFQEVLRVLKPDGLFYLNVPSNGAYHRYPNDSWRFYPDAGKALCVWGERCGYTPILLESFITQQERGVWNDFIAVFVKDREQAARYPRRLASIIKGAENVWLSERNDNEPLAHQEWPEDIRRRQTAADFLRLQMN